MDDFKYLIVLLDSRATSFCYYDHGTEGNKNGLQISVDILKKITDYSVQKNLSINFLYPERKLPAAFEQLIAKTSHVDIVPFGVRKRFREAIVVANPDDIPELKNNHKEGDLNLILRWPGIRLNELSEAIKVLMPVCGRINLVLHDIEHFRQADLDMYAKQLEKIRKQVLVMYHSGKPVELNFISDRILLTQMSNCDAGLTHLTFAPNGRFYLCPAFYYQNPENSVGDLSNGIEIKNKQLLFHNHAPICRNCDAFHCRRCLYLNKLMTNEINTPSHEQCVISHLERNVSKKILDELRPLVSEFGGLPEIPELPYLDPFEYVVNIPQDNANFIPSRVQPTETQESFENMTDREILYSIYRMQQEILSKLKN